MNLSQLNNLTVEELLRAVDRSNPEVKALAECLEQTIRRSEKVKTILERIGSDLEMAQYRLSGVTPNEID